MSILGAALAAACLVASPALAQEQVPDLEGGPGSRSFPEAPPQLKAPPSKPAAKPASQKPAVEPAAPSAAERKRLVEEAEKQKAEAARLAQLAAKQAAEEKRLAKLAEEQEAEQARLDRLAAQLAESDREIERKRAEHERAIRESAEQRQLAELSKPSEPADDLAGAPAREFATAEAGRPEDRAARWGHLGGDNRENASSGDRWLGGARVDFAAARKSCADAAADEAWARNYYSAQYVGRQQLIEGRGYELRGQMRLEDRRGYFLVNTRCEIRRSGEAIHFEFLR